MANPAPDDRFAEGRPAPARPGAPDDEPPDDEPEAPPVSLPRLGEGDGGGLSSLAQSAREKQINTARVILFAIGVLSIVVNIVLILMVRSNVETELRKLGFDPRNLPPEMQPELARVYLINYLVHGGFLAVAIVFIVLGALVRQYPVGCTITGLVLYLGTWAASGLIDPKNLAMGIIIKVIIVVCLVKAVQAALAAEREKQSALAGMDDDA